MSANNTRLKLRIAAIGPTAQFACTGSILVQVNGRFTWPTASARSKMSLLHFYGIMSCQPRIQRTAVLAVFLLRNYSTFLYGGMALSGFIMKTLLLCFIHQD